MKSRRILQNNATKRLVFCPPVSVFDPIPLQGALSNSMPKSNKVQASRDLLQTPLFGKLGNFQYQFLNSYFHLLPSIASLDSKITELQYKVLNRILYANTALFKMRIFYSHLCTFCQISRVPRASIYTLSNVKRFLAFCSCYGWQFTFMHFAF